MIRVMNPHKLKKLLEERGHTQAELAGILGRDKSAVTLLVQGKRQLKAEEAKRIAEWLRLPLEELLGSKPIEGFAEGEALIPFQSAPKLTLKSAQVIKRDGKHFLRDSGQHSDKSYALEMRDDALNLSGVLPGDILISQLDLSCSKGNIVIFQLYNKSGAQTLVRKYEPPFLVPHSTNPAFKTIAAEDENVRLVSPVTKLVRLL